MKTTFDIPEELLVRAKKLAAEQRRPLRTLVTEGLRDQVSAGHGRKRPRITGTPRIRWVTAPGGVPPGLDMSDRARMHDWLRGRP